MKISEINKYSLPSSCSAICAAPLAVKMSKEYLQRIKEDNAIPQHELTTEKILEQYKELEDLGL